MQSLRAHREPTVSVCQCRGTYHGAAEGDRFGEQTREGQADNILLRMRPERWLTADYAKASL
jgi:hypothetical protein